MLARLCWIWLVLCCTLNASTANAAEPTLGLDRRSWSPIDGAPTNVWDIAQSSDGLLWFASPTGLVRFDGERFQRVERVYGHALQSQNVSGVFAVSHGIGVLYQFGGMSVFTPEQSHFYDTSSGLPTGNLGSAIQTPDGLLYAGTSTGLALLKDQHWQLERDNGLPAKRVNKVMLDHAGVLWVSQAGILYGRPPGARQFKAVSALEKLRTPELINGKVYAYLPDGKVACVVLGQPITPILEHVSLTADAIFQGPQSRFLAWLSKGGGLVLLQPQPLGTYTIAAHYDAQPVHKNMVVSALRDREDNIWLGTANGVERLRIQRIHSLPLPEGVFMPYIHPGLKNAVLVSGQFSPGIQQLDAKGLKSAYALPNAGAMWREHENSLWIGNAAGLYHITPEGQRRYALPVTLQDWQTIQAITVSKAGEVLVSIVGHGVFRLSQQQWQALDTSGMGKEATPITLHAGASGQIWLGFSHNRLGQLVGNAVRQLPLSASAGIGNVLSIVEIDGRLIVGGETGLLWIDQRAHSPLRPEQMDSLRGVSGLGLDPQGGLWAHASDGIYHLKKSQLDQFWSQPQHRLAWQVYNLADGVQGNPAQIRPLPSLSVSNDGKVLYATNAQIGWIDPATMPRNPRAPDVLLLNLRVGGADLAAKTGMQLAAGTNAIEFKYAVTAMSVPEKVQIKYRLSTIDGDWQVANGERIARYTNLPPGQYRFQVIAANEDGVWNERGALFEFEILPRFWQTSWFRLCLLALLAACAYLVHRQRIALATARATERMQARMEERERIARNLHDDLLQGVHALILRCSSILSRLPRGSQEERSLDNVLEQAEQLVQQTRAQVMDLRCNESTRALIANMEQALEMSEPATAGRLSLHLAGAIDLIAPAVARELCRVLKEAAINAVRHADASKIMVTLEVQHALIQGAVADNGKGMPADVAQHGVTGHWGITGMRERIQALGGRFEITTSERGTTVSFQLPLNCAPR